MTANIVFNETLSIDHTRTYDDGQGHNRMKNSILFACRANVCRSPLMHFTFAQEVADSGAWAVASAGTAAQPGSLMCTTAVSMVPSEHQEAASKHTSVMIEDTPLDADLIIAASRKERAVIASSFPQVRSRLFTLTEAVLLGRLARSGPGPSQKASKNSSSHFTQLLDAQRGMVTIPRHKKQFKLFPASQKAHPFDIPDAHHLSRSAHQRALKRVRDETIELAALISELQAQR